MTTYYGELKDHDGSPAIDRMMNSTAARKSTVSEMSLDLDDLEDLHFSPKGKASPSNSSSSNALGLLSWAHEPEATTGNLLAGGYWGASMGSLDSILETDDERCRQEFPSADGNRPRHNSEEESISDRVADNPLKGSLLGRSRSWDGCLCGSMSELELIIDRTDRVKKTVRFEAPARLEDIQEFEKPAFEDYNKLYYMTHEIQKMMDDFKSEGELERHVIR